MTPYSGWIVLGLVAGLLVGAVVPVAAVGLLVVLPVVATTGFVSWLWRRSGWSLWPLLGVAGVGLWVATELGATALYADAVRLYGDVSGRVSASDVFSSLMLSLPLSVPLGAALAVPLLVRRESILRVGSWLRPRWLDLEPGSVEQCPLCDGDGRVVRQETVKET